MIKYIILKSLSSNMSSTKKFFTKIIHRCNSENWIKTEEIINPQTLVLGSFNPMLSCIIKDESNNDFPVQVNRKMCDNVNYYYGRPQNYFWKIIAEIKGKESGFYFNSDKNIKLETLQNSFICLDVIDSLTIECDDLNLMKEYIEKDIFKTFSDSALFTNKTKYKKIFQKREYNKEVLNYIKDSTSLKKVIHTMGETRISATKISPSTDDLSGKSFKNYIAEIIDECKKKRIEFIYNSQSPSSWSIRKKGNYSKFKCFLQNHINFN